MFFLKVIFILSELESVELFQQTLASNLTSTTLTTLFGPITFDSNLQRSFTYAFVGRQCNGSWTVLRTVTSAFAIVDTNLNACINYPTGDVVAADDSGKSRGITNREKRLFIFLLHRLADPSYCSLYAIGHRHCM